MRTGLVLQYGGEEPFQRCRVRTPGGFGGNCPEFEDSLNYRSSNSMSFQLPWKPQLICHIYPVTQRHWSWDYCVNKFWWSSWSTQGCLWHSLTLFIFCSRWNNLIHEDQAGKRQRDKEQQLCLSSSPPSSFATHLFRGRLNTELFHVCNLVTWHVVNAWRSSRPDQKRMSLEVKGKYSEKWKDLLSSAKWADGLKVLNVKRTWYSLKSKIRITFGTSISSKG